MNHFGNVQKTSALALTKDTYSSQQAGTQQVQKTSALTLTKDTSSSQQAQKTSVQAPKPTQAPKHNTFVEFFSQDFLKPQDILTQEQIKSLDVQFPNAGSGVDDIGLPILILVAIGIDFGAAVQFAKDQAEMEKVLTEEQMNQVGELFEKIGESLVTGGKLPNELLEGGAFSLTTKEKEKKAKLKKTILYGVGATALIGGLIYLVRKK